MYTILDYIWTKIRIDSKQRIMIIDEAWWMMQYEDSAKFLHGLAKRARKYFLGLTIISQDVEDFLGSKYGKAVVANSSMQILMKQSTASIDIVSEVFNLTEGEKYLLLESDVGEGLLFAGLNHVAIKVVASYTEDQIINTEAKQALE
jgi:type IV secretory pathway VirB4 component